MDGSTIEPGDGTQWFWKEILFNSGPVVKPSAWLFHSKMIRGNLEEADNSDLRAIFNLLFYFFSDKPDLTVDILKL